MFCGCFAFCAYLVLVGLVCETTIMTDDVCDQLADLAETLRTLPDEARADVLVEIGAKVEQLKRSHVTDAQRAIVKRRVLEPRIYAAPA